MIRSPIRGPHLRNILGGTGVVGQYGQVLDYDFGRDLYFRAGGGLLTLAQATQFTRASVADWLNPAGDGLSPQAAINALRRDARGALIETSIASGIRNSTGIGAVVGSPGVLPTFWNLSIASGLSREIVATGTINGAPYIDIRVFGTATDTQLVFNLAAEGGTFNAGAVGQTWVATYSAQLLSGTLPSGGLNVRVTELGAGSSFLTSTGTNFPNPSVFSRVSHAKTLSNASVQTTQGVLWSGSAVVSATYDVTIRVSLPSFFQQPTGSGITDTSPILTSGSAATRAAELLSTSLAGLGVGTAGTAVVIARSAPFGRSSATYLQLHDGVGSNLITLRNNSGANSFIGIPTNAAAQSTTFPNVATPAANSRFAAAFAFSGMDLALSLNGGAPSTTAPDVSAPSNIMTLQIGSQVFGGNPCDSFVERVILFPTRRSNADLQLFSQLATWGG